jgi:hypothetical protein
VRFYKFKNDVPSHLGNEPLPDGNVKAFRFATDDKLYSFVGRTNVKYIPVNEEVEMELGNDLEVRAEPKLMSWAKTNIHFNNKGDVDGWTAKETWQIELQNSKEIDLTLDMRRNFSGDWSLATDAAFEKMDAKKVRFLVQLKPREKQTLTYELTTRHGTNATR